jgi:hypothetical protein
MRVITTLMTSFILLLSVPHTAFAHGIHHEVTPYSFAHLLTHNWPLLIVLALLIYGLWKKYKKLN